MADSKMVNVGTRGHCDYGKDEPRLIDSFASEISADGDRIVMDMFGKSIADGCTKITIGNRFDAIVTIYPMRHKCYNTIMHRVFDFYNNHALLYTIAELKTGYDFYIKLKGKTVKS